jgi:hypothetical protein
MKKSPLSILAALAALSSAPLGAQTPAPDAATYFAFLGASDRQTLLAKNELTAVGQDVAALPLGVKAPFASEVSSGLTVVKPTLAIEGFFLYPRPSGDLTLPLYNAVNSLASMEGLQYYSVSQKKMETLILASYRVTGTDKPQKVADPVFTAVPPFQKAVVFQKDNRLGDGLSEVTWKALPGGAVVLTLKNLQTLNYGILPLVEPGNLQMVFVVVPLADRVAVYGALDGKTASLFGLEKSKDESFRNRMRALAGWLGARIAAAGK